MPKSQISAAESLKAIKQLPSNNASVLNDIPIKIVKNSAQYLKSLCL